MYSLTKITLYDIYLVSRKYKGYNFIIKRISNLAKTNMRLFNSQCSNKQLHVLEHYRNVYIYICCSLHYVRTKYFLKLKLRSGQETLIC